MDQFEFQWEVHEVTTDDGYILNMFRLVGPRDDSRLYDSSRHRIIKESQKFYPERMQKQDDQRKLAEERLF